MVLLQYTYLMVPVLSQCSALLLYDGFTSIKFWDKDTNLMVDYVAATSQSKLTNFL